MWEIVYYGRPSKGIYKTPTKGDGAFEGGKREEKEATDLQRGKNIVDSGSEIKSNENKRIEVKPKKT